VVVPPGAIDLERVNPSHARDVIHAQVLLALDGVPQTIEHRFEVGHIRAR
jgi:hypothetical protein